MRTMNRSFLLTQLTLLIFMGALLSIPSNLTAQSQGNSATNVSEPTSTSANKNGEFSDPFEQSASRQITLSDPIEPWNRLVFEFNDVTYENVLHPTTRFYRDYVGLTIRRSLRNVFQNLDEPRNTVNGVLQGKPMDAGVSLTRFIINSTVGIAGIFDPAENHLDQRNRRLDQTFATWNIPPGPYLVWPLYGPSSARGSVGEFGDGFLYPPYYIRGEDAFWAKAAIYGTRNINELSFHLGRYEEFKGMAVDPYTGLKNAYEQRLEKRRSE